MGATAFRRFTPHVPEPGRASGLSPDHPAVVEERPLFPVSPVADAPRLLIGGHNNRKIGKVVFKGAWRGFPIYTLTLPERTTCPRSCPHWLDCYGNAMPFARRHEPGPLLEDVLAVEVMQTAARHPEGVVVRLHVLGDFYSVPYVELWGRMLARFPALHAWGYTAYRADADAVAEREIGRALADLRARFPGRFRIRVSGEETVVVERKEDAGEALVCPAELSEKAGCGTCAWCWERDETIAFIRHGMVRPTGPRKPRSGPKKSEAVAALQKAHPDLAPGELARRAGCSTSYVYALRAKGEIAAPGTRVRETV